jgi:predicted transcriptional regulator
MSIEIRKCGLIMNKGKDSVQGDLRENILKSLENSPMSFDELSKLCEVDRIIMVEALKELIDEEKVTKTKDENRVVFQLS